jgi:hypothetical protein
VRAFLVVLALAALTAGCSSSTSSEGSAPKAGTLAALWKASKQSVALIPGTNDYAPGTIRVSFLVVDSTARVIAPPTARVWLARSLDSPPFQQTVARLEDVGVPGVSTGADSPTIYVAHLRVPAPGKYVVLARPLGGSVSISGIRDLIVHRQSVSPALGTRAYPSQTPTIASTGGNFRKLTTRVPPDRALLSYSIADSLAKHIPFVVTFATPRYCSSRVCGPVVDVVDRVRKRFEGRGIRFIHVEIYKNNDPRQGRNEWVTQWKLPSEPWTFLVGRDGLIKAKFEGSVSASELGSTIKSKLR